MHANKPQPGLSEKAPGPGLSEHGLRTVLLLAFGGLLALMLVASVSALLSLRQLHAVEQQVASRFLSRTQALSEVVNLPSARRKFIPPSGATPRTVDPGNGSYSRRSKRVFPNKRAFPPRCCLLLRAIARRDPRSLSRSSSYRAA